MLITLLAEILMVLITVWRYKFNVLARLVSAAVLALAVFQLAEYYVCTGYGLNAEVWSRVGFVAITTLPPLGLHILHVLANIPKRKMVVATYILMVAFSVFFLVYHTAFIGHQCTGNYVIFQIGDRMAAIYGAYYYGLLISSILLGVKWASRLENADSGSKLKLETTRGLIIGYFIFLLPTAIANTIQPETRRGIPSIMCGFAVLFALILVFYILPKAGQIKTSHNSRP
ncbi:MAG: hypothetical protein NVS1B10_06060 [Candidatus Saccharimonadales bacterium]